MALGLLPMLGMGVQAIESATFAGDSSVSAGAAAPIGGPADPAPANDRITSQRPFHSLEADYAILILRTGAVFVALYQLISLTIDYLGGGLLPFALPCYLFNIACALLLFAAAFHRRAWIERNWRVAALLSCAAVTLSMGLLALLQQAPAPLLISSILFLVGTALLLPWEPSWQAAFSIVPVGTTLLIGLFATRDYNYTGWLGLFCAAALGQCTTIVRTNFRRANDRLVAQLAVIEARQRSLLVERERAAQQLANSEAMLRRVFDSTLDSILIARFGDGVFTYVNRAFHEEFGYTRQQVIGVPSLDLGLWVDPSERLDYRRRLAADGVVRNLELTLRRRDGSLAPVLVSGALIDLNGERCVVSMMRDITRIKQTERDLIAAREAALAASRAKSEFLSTMSHEIRTPMNMIMGTADLLAETPLNPEQRKYLEVMRNNGTSLLLLISDILDLAKVESGRLTLEQSAFDLVSLIDTATEAMGVRAYAKGLELVARIAPGVPLHLLGDPLRTRQILINLIGNAIKFTDRGEIVVSVSPESASDSPVMLHFTVRDTGIGIPANRLEDIFANFTQADSSTSRCYGGSGLGLTIVRRLAELMGGRAWAESAPGAGQHFSFHRALWRSLGSGSRR